MLQTTPPTSSTLTNDGPVPTAREVQRTALRDLLLLSRELSTSEVELEARHRVALEEASKKFDRQHREVQYRIDAIRKQIDEKFETRLMDGQNRRRQELSRLAALQTQRRGKVTAEYEQVKKDLKKRYDQAAWLADSVLEAAEVQASLDVRKQSDRDNDLQEFLARREADIAAVVQTYGVAPEPVPPPSLDAASIAASADDELVRQQAEVERLSARLKRLSFARLLVGVWPVVVVLFACLAAAAFVMWQRQSTAIDWPSLMYPVGGAFVGAIVLCVILKVLAGNKVRATYTPLRQAIANARLASTVVADNAAKARQAQLDVAKKQRDAEVLESRQAIAPLQVKALQQRDNQSKSIDADNAKGVAQVEADYVRLQNEVAAAKQAQLDEAAGRLKDDQLKLRQQYEAEMVQLKGAYTERRHQLQKRWHDGLVRIQAPIGDSQSTASLRTDWSAVEQQYVPPRSFPETVAFGSLEIDMAKLSEGIPRDGTFQLALPDHFAVPALLGFPREASLLIQTDPAGRDEGVRALQMMMMKLLTALPPGRGRFTIIDPVGLGQSFAGFMHLADHDDQLVNGRIWTTPEQIEQRLADLTEHMETVIQKYLRNEFETIDDYNAQAGELAEPYRYLVIADFPNGFEGESWRRLLSIVRTGARCGVYTLILRDIRQTLPPEMMMEDLESAAVNLVRENGRFVWRDEIYAQFPLTLDAPPDEETLTRIANKVGRGAKEASRVQVDFDAIAPKPDQFWSRSAAEEIAVPVGRMGATRLQYFRCGKGVAQHTLTAGKTGSGKSTLLHAMVTNLAMWYSPDEVEFYLIDFKKGVEFKVYADHQLPHARAIAVESDREFGLSVLQRIDAELSRRGEIYRKVGVQDLASYRGVTGAEAMPRVMLIIDEFQEFFSEDDKLAQDAQLLLDRLVRQGRAFGIHVFLGSQTIGGSGGLARTTIGQMAIRIALQCSESDSQLILGDNNSAARLLSRPGEAIYNDAGGAVENNSPFQVAWLPDAKRERYLSIVTDKVKSVGTKRPVIPPIVFEGNAAADITKNAQLTDRLEHPSVRGASAPLAWVGDPVAIKEPTAVIFRRQSGSNLLLVGQQDEQALSTLAACALSLGAQLPINRARFLLLDGTPTDSSFAGELPRVLSALPHDVQLLEYRGVETAINDLTEELSRRQADESEGGAAIFLIINGLQRYRSLRKGEEEFSFSVSDEPKKPSAAKQLVDLVREGPNVGIHVIAWCDTLASIERTFERGIMREFDNRILFQMSANDSSNLIDSPVANKLGFFRALAFSEEQGVMEKFRPYGLPPASWLAEYKAKLQTANA